MKITFISAVFPPEPEPDSVMARQLAEKLSQEGYSIDVIAPVPNRPSGKIYEGFSWRSNPIEQAPSGYRIIRCPHWLIGSKRRFRDRVLENLTFGISAVWAAWRAGKPDLLIVETWPLFAVQCAAFLAAWWRIPFLYYVQDVFPEAAEQAGYTGVGSYLSGILRQWDARLCRQSARVIAISPPMAALLKQTRNLPESQLAVIPNWQDAAEFPVIQARGEWRAEQQIPPHAFVAMFAGTMGHVSGAEVLVEVAQRLRSEADILIVCIGEGILKKKMQELARARGLSLIRFLPFQPRERLAEVQQSADAMLLTVQQNVGDTSVPSKLISYMAAGRPVICAAMRESTVSQTVTESGSGLAVPAGDPAAIARAILDLSLNRDEAAQMGRRARAYFEEKLTLDRAYRQFSELVAEVTDSQCEMSTAAGL